jgi:hypothetical protein
MLVASRRLGFLALLQGKAPEAEAILTNTTAIERRVLGPENTETLASMVNLVPVYGEEGKSQRRKHSLRRCLRFSAAYWAPSIATH